MQVRLKRVATKKRVQKWDTDKLKTSENARISFQNEVETKVKKFEQDNQNRNANDRWEQLKNAVTVGAEGSIGYKKRTEARKPWITVEMIENWTREESGTM